MSSVQTRRIAGREALRQIIDVAQRETIEFLDSLDVAILSFSNPAPIRCEVEKLRSALNKLWLAYAALNIAHDKREVSLWDERGI